MREFFYLHDPGLSGVYLGRVLLSLVLAFFCGQCLAWVYMFTHSGLSYSRNFVRAMVTIPVTVALVMAVLDNNLVTAFSLMGVFAIVRFRNIIRDTLDTVFLMTLIVVGMAAGTQRPFTALLGVVLFCAIQLYLFFSDFGSRIRHDYLLNVRWGASAETLDLLVTSLKRHALMVQKIHEMPAQTPGEGLNLSYRLLLRDPNGSGLMLEEINALGDVLSVSGLPAGGEHEV